MQEHQPISIIDRREIEFDTKVLISAIVASSKSVSRIGLPPLRPIALQFSPNEELIEFHYDNQEPIRVTAAKLGAFLVSYCVRARIPLPRNSDKRITVGANSLTISLMTVYAEAPARDDGTGVMRFSRVKG